MQACGRVSEFFFFSSRRRHTRLVGDWSSECALPIFQTDPAAAATRRNLASNQFQLGRLEEARGNLEQVLRAKPDDRTATLLLGMVEEERRVGKECRSRWSP